MAEAERSSRLKALTKQRLWGTASTDEEAREQLQNRLNVYSRIMFWAFVALIVFLTLTYRFVLDKTPALWTYVFAGSTVLLAVMAFIWRAVLVRRKVTVEGLFAIDLAYAITIGLAFGAAAAAQYDFPPASYTSLIFAGLNVFMRALVVPSSPRRTAVISTVTFLPVVGAGLFLGLIGRNDPHLPAVAVVVGGALLAAISIIIASTGSEIIYSLRQEAHHAMQLGQYTTGERIGSGGMGQVFKAQHRLLRRPCAVKLIRPDLGAENLDRFEREVQEMSQLTHPNTVAVYDYGRGSGGVFYYAMEYLDGIDLEQLVKRRGKLPAGRVIPILVQVCGALQEAHDRKLIHRDIKPANIILCERGGVPDVAKVVDFGLVKDFTHTTGQSTQVVLGTVGYMAPEQLTEPDRVGPPSDIYALGCVGYFLLTGRKVFEGKTDVDICMQHITKPPDRPSESGTAHIPKALEDAILRCLEKTPSARFTSASDLAEALEAIPRERDWSRAEATQWWAEFKSQPKDQDITEQKTMTVRVDLDRRSTSAPLRGAARPGEPGLAGVRKT
ncbi:MAG: protein kinase [Deltaproteobacteria bacterium]|nr:protein kinase [Deltaproteobacteria bacterium]